MSIRKGQWTRFWDSQAVLQIRAQHLTREQIEQLVSRACSRAYLKRRYGAVLRWGLSVDFADRSSGRKQYACESRTIIVPPDEKMWTADALCRIVAWCIYKMSYDRAPRYRYYAILLDVVRALMGKPSHDLLRESYRQNGVRFREKRIRAFTPEQREAARQRMLRIRENAK